MFWKKIFLNRMMEFQVKFCHHSGLRLWRTGMLFSTKSKCHKSNVRISWMYRYSFYDLKVHFWWPNKCLLSRISSLNTLYFQVPFWFWHWRRQALTSGLSESGVSGGAMAPQDFDRSVIPISTRGGGGCRLCPPHYYLPLPSPRFSDLPMHLIRVCWVRCFS